MAIFVVVPTALVRYGDLPSASTGRSICGSARLVPLMAPRPPPDAPAATKFVFLAATSPARGRAGFAVCLSNFAYAVVSFLAFFVAFNVLRHLAFLGIPFRARRFAGHGSRRLQHHAGARPVAGAPWGVARPELGEESVFVSDSPCCVMAGCSLQHACPSMPLRVYPDRSKNGTGGGNLSEE